MINNEVYEIFAEVENNQKLKYLECYWMFV